MNLYQIRDLLQRQEKAVFSSHEISRIAKLSKKSVPIYMQRMKAKGLIYLIEKNKYSLTQDPFIVASQLVQPSYISLSSALYLHNVHSQVIDRLEVITSRHKKPVVLFGSKSSFHTISPFRMFGYRKVKKEQSFILLADIEKTIIDCIYLQKFCPLHTLLPALRAANISTLEEYARRFKSESVLRRLCYLLDLAGIGHSLRRTSNIVYKLNPARKKKGTFNKKWYLYINEEI